MTTNHRDRIPDAEVLAKNDHDYRAFSHLQHLLTYHQQLLSDAERNQTFYRAIKRHVNPRTRVLDIGSGTGVWAIAAAKLGARRVVAVEKEPLLIPIIEKLAIRNNVHTRLEVVAGDSREVKLKGKFDVIISETVGNHGFDEEIVPIIVDAKKRFLEKDGIVIPRAINAMAAPAHLINTTAPLPAGIGLDYGFFEMLAQDVSRKITDPKMIELLAPPATLAQVDLMRATVPPALAEMKCTWRLKDASQMNCLIVFAKVWLTERISLSTVEHNRGWNPVCLPVEPFAQGPATVECAITISNKQYYWIVTRIKNGQRQVQSHSPVFPYTLIQSRIAAAAGKAN